MAGGRPIATLMRAEAGGRPMEAIPFSILAVFYDLWHLWCHKIRSATRSIFCHKECFYALQWPVVGFSVGDFLAPPNLLVRTLPFFWSVDYGKALFAFSATISVVYCHKHFMKKRRGQYPFRKAVLRDRAGDTAKRWYVEFYVWDIRKSKLVRKQDYDINASPDPFARRRAAIKIIGQINEALENGYVYDAQTKPVLPVPEQPCLAPDGPPRGFRTLTGRDKLITAMEAFIEKKARDNGIRSKQAYATWQRRLLAYLKRIDNTAIALQHVNTQFIHLFLEDTRSRYSLSNTTFNAYLLMTKALFGHYYDLDVITADPARRIKSLKETRSSKHAVYTDQEAFRIMQHLKAIDPQLYLFCNFIYYSFIRPKELRFLQVKHLQAGRIEIPSLLRGPTGQVQAVSKNRKRAYVMLFDSLQQLIDTFEIQRYPPDYFIFNAKGHPHTFPVSANYFNTRYRQVANELGIGYDKTMYSWKHTGVVKLYQTTRDIKLIQQQCRHSRVNTTDVYLRDLILLDERKIDFKGFD